MLRCLVGNTPENWDLALAQAEFAFNDFPNRSKGFGPIYVVYDMHPRGVFELRNLGDMEKRSASGKDFSKVIHYLHEEVKMNIEENNQQYK